MPVPVARFGKLEVRLARFPAGSLPKEIWSMDKWEYRVVYVDPRGRISAEGVEFVRQSGENRTAFMKRYLDTLGDEGWEIAGLHPLVRTESSYVILKRPKAAA
jgi:hypothetical protein